MKALMVSLLLSAFLVLPQSDVEAGAEYALQFDGDTDFVDLGYTLTGTRFDDVSVEIWIQPGIQTCTWGACVYDGKDGEFQIGFVPPRDPQFGVKTQGYDWQWILLDDTLDSSWHYLAGVYNSEVDRLYLYYDDTYVDSVDIPDTQLYTPGGDWTPKIGSRSGGGGEPEGFFNGSIDEVRIWNVARTTEEIHENMHSLLTGDEEGLVGYWRFNEGLGQIANDLSPYENHGQLGHTPNKDNGDPSWVLSGALLGPLSMLLEPDATVFYRGDYLGFTVTAINPQDSSLSCEVWTEVETAWGWLITPALGPFDVTFPPKRTISRHIQHFIPWYTPLGGPYKYYGVAGVYPDDVLDEDSFEFYVYP